MTNHIEEMMKMAGIEKNYCENCDQVVNIDCLLYGCDKQGYPAFTAEKQLEIIKLLFGGTYDFNGFFGSDNKFHLHLKSLMAFNQDFTQALANLTTELMKANELDKEKVKGILEG